MILYNSFFRKICVRKKEHIFSPRFLSLSEFELPRGALFHYVPQDLTEFGIEQNDLLINKYSDDIYIDHVRQIKTPLGNPMHKTLSLNNMIKQYHNKHKRFKLVRNIGSVMANQRYCIVENYAMAQHQLVYRPAMFVNYFRWYNMQYTVMEKMTQIQKDTERNQFIYLQMPASLPQLSQLRVYDERMSKGLDKVPGVGNEIFEDATFAAGLESMDDYDQGLMLDVALEALEDLRDYNGLEEGERLETSYTIQLDQLMRLATGNEVCLIPDDLPEFRPYMEHISAGIEALGAFQSRVMRFKPELQMSVMNRLRTANDYWFIHFWLWLGSHREASLFSMLDHDRKQLEKIHLVIGNVGAYSVIRLDVIEQWREEILKQSKNGNLDNFRKHILKFMTKLFEVKTGGQDVAEEDEQAEVVSPIVQPKVEQVSESAAEDVGDGVDDSPAPAVPTSIFGVEIPSVQETPAEPVKKPEAKPAANPAEGDEPLSDIDVYEQRSFNDDIADDEFNHDREGRAAPIVPSNTVEAKPEDGISAYIEVLSDAGMLTAAEYKRFKRLAEAYKNIPNPVGPGTLLDLMTIDPAKLNNISGGEAPDSVSILNKDMLKTCLNNLDKNYIENILEADIANVVMSLQNTGVAIIDYQREEKQDAVTKFVVYTVQVQPVGGKVSTVRFRIPKLDPDGTTLTNNVKSRVRKQRVDIPIRKVSATKVSMTSYYGKMFMSRSEMVKYDYGKWLGNRINLLSLTNPDDSTYIPPVTNLVIGRYFVPSIAVPHAYAIIAQRYKGFHYQDIDFLFSIKQTKEQFGDEVWDRYYGNKLTICGSKHGSPVLMDRPSNLYLANGDTLEPLGDLESFLGLDVSKAPVETVELQVFRKPIAVGVILAYYYGLTTMIEQLQMQVRFVQRGERLNLTADERTITFNDEVLVFNRSDRLTAMLLNGFNYYEKEVQRFSRYDFDRKSVYANLLASVNLGVRWIRELDLLREMFIDPITRDELKRMNAPIRWDLLLMHGVKMLLDDRHIRETSMREQRIRGSERVAGAVYKELVKSARQLKTRSTATKAGLELHPDAVWYELLDDTASTPIEECNPIHNIKDYSVVTFGGTGGRTARSMTKPTREFIADNLGVVSESSVDNSDVGYTAHMTSDPLITDLRGNAQAATDETDPAHLVSFTALLNPGSDRDSPQRVMFTSVQHSQAMYAVGYKTTPYRTGAERMVAHRVSKMFSYAAEADGVVKEVSDKHLLADYGDRLVGVEIGTRFGTASGTTYVHEIITDLKPGDTFRKGAILVWNRNYFERDFMEPDQVSWKGGVIVNTALMEDQFTYEDSSMIYRGVGKDLATFTGKPIPIIVNFGDEVRNLITVGEEVEQETILCTLEHPVSAQLGLDDDGSFDSLRVFSNDNPKAKVVGRVAKIDVLYRGNIEDMSESLAIIANRSDRERRKLNRALRGTDAETGEVMGGLRIGGDTLEPKQAVIYVYLITPMPTIIGDKGVFANQMKSTFGYIYDDQILTVSGKEVGAIFSNLSIANRMVTSPYIIGAMNSYLDTVTKNAFKLWRSMRT
ncbi:hypothetical protein pEaSNUABM37_00170 [Erwinia phage pEa_SNUABM_37]|nr:hypothetical protein pEaSNUABM37_00170 [Erwinia phage pEa_SNUABM_37]QXO10640.1 hypothetical protein pEaSNUABM48_00170 [Erwinia phage pEa_SNUABM_48]